MTHDGAGPAPRGWSGAVMCQPVARGGRWQRGQK
ncbi:hypothetical protein SFR_1668 [Streptomyces sp. FR-008]|nr:hypothetical protein SFR_1668 [Streptomyces sp. FR-008]